MKSLIRTNLIVLASVGLIVGCNSILDNNPGTLKQAANPTTQTDPTQTSSSSSSSGGGEVVQPVPTTPSPTGECAADTVLCGGQCVGKNDPAYGCGTCTACAITHGSSTCTAGACAVKACDRGYADCNAKADDGCEVDLSKAESCGACGAACPVTAPACSAVGDTFSCGLTCNAPTPFLCGGSCVDLKSNANNCNACGNACPTVENADSTCAAGQCGFTCKAGSNLCGGRCAAANDATACGATCTVCPTPAGTIASCTNGVCGQTCSAGMADCNANPADGCESTLATDVANCGACGAACNGTCAGGVCTPAPTDDAGTTPPPPP